MKRIFLAAASALALICASTPVAGAQPSREGIRHAVVSVSVNYMREEPGYSKENGDQSLMGTVVEVLDRQGSWVKIRTVEPYTAWVDGMGLAMMDEAETQAYVAAPKYICTALYSHVLDAPSKDAGFVCDLVAGDLLRQAGKDGEALDRDGAKPLKKGGYLGVVLPSGVKGWVPTKDVEVFSDWASGRSMTEGNILSTGRLFLGVPYFWGGTSIKGVDCSGFVRSVFYLNGVLLPRNASQQAKVGQDIPVRKAGTESSGTSLSPEECLDFEVLRPGDLLFYNEKPGGRITHVSIYLGDGMIIHSSGRVRINSIRDQQREDFYNRRPVVARRIIGHLGEEGITDILSSPAYFPQGR